MPKKKILHIIKSMGRGGAEMLLPETLKLHNQDAFEFHYIYFLPWKNQMVETIEAAGGIVTCIPASSNLKILLQYPKIITYCKQHDIELIHAHLPFAGFVSRIVHFATKIPLIYTEHNLQNRYHFLTKIINKFTFNFQTLGLGVSEEVTLAVQKNIKPKIPVQTLLNGVNTDYFKRSETDGIRNSMRLQYGIPKDAFVVGNVAVFRAQKRLDLWLQLFKKVHDTHSNVYGLIVGSGPLEPMLKKQLNALELTNKVIFVGLQTIVKPYYETMDCFMMTSEFEGLPVALLEAMSMECAIVSTDAGGIKEVIQSRKEGIIQSVAEWEKLGDELVTLVEQPEVTVQLKVAARKRVLESFSLQAMVTELETLYFAYLQ